MEYMFYNCSSLVNLNLNNFNTENAVDISNMFNYCSNLLNLNFPFLNTLKCTKYDNIFDGCYDLTLIINSNLCGNIINYIPDYINITDLAIF